jgi:hypothetical protein
VAREAAKADEELQAMRSVPEVSRSSQAISERRGGQGGDIHDRLYRDGMDRVGR